MSDSIAYFALTPPAPGLRYGDRVKPVALWKAGDILSNATFPVVDQYSYQQAKSTPANDWVYQLQAGMFDGPTGLTLSPYISPGAGGVNAKYAILSLIEAGVPPATFPVVDQYV